MDNAVAFAPLHGEHTTLQRALHAGCESVNKGPVLLDDSELCNRLP